MVKDSDVDVLGDVTNVQNVTPCDCNILTENDIPGAKLENDIEKCKKNELLFWLKCRGMTVKKSETKAQLCARLRKCMSATVPIPIVDPDPGKCYSNFKRSNCVKCTQKTNESEKKTMSAVSAAKDKSCSEAIHKKMLPVDGWTNSTDNIPQVFSTFHIVKYARSTGKKKSSVEKPMDKGYKFFWDGYVHNVMSSSQNNKAFLKARCYRSLKKNESPHSLSVCLDSSTGQVLTANCSCVAGVTGHCNHVFALLYAIDHCKKLKLATFPKKKTCTEKPAEWSKCRTDGVHPQPVMELGVYKPRYGSKSNGITSTLYEARAPPVQQTSQLECTELINSLKELNQNLGIMNVLNLNDSSDTPTRLGFSVKSGSVLSYQLSVTEGDFKVSQNIDCPNLTDLQSCDQIQDNLKNPPSFPWNQNSAPNVDKDCINLLKLSLTAEECEKLEIATRGQSTNPAWFEARKNRLSASKFGLVLQRKTTNNEKFVKNTIIQKKDLSHVLAVKYGLDNENKAVECYLKYMKNTGNCVKTFESGFVVNSEFPWTGASPDRVVFDKKLGFGLVEVKCAYSKKEVNPLDACEDPSFFCKKNDEGLPELKQEHNYYAQVQGQMGICGSNWCDFVVYTNKGMIVQRIPFDKTFWDTMMPKLRDFYIHHVVPVITQCLNH